MSRQSRHPGGGDTEKLHQQERHQTQVGRVQIRSAANAPGCVKSRTWCDLHAEIPPQSRYNAIQRTLTRSTSIEWLVEHFVRRASGDAYKTLEPRFLESKEGLMPSSSG